MGWLVLGSGVLIALLLGANWLSSADPKGLARALKWFSIAVGSLLLGFLAFSGRAAFLLPLLLFAWPFLRGQLIRRGFGGGHGGPFAGRGWQPSSGQTSNVETGTLSMTLDHDSGKLDGKVLMGVFAGRRLASLGLADLLALLFECGKKDPESVPLIEAYLDRAHPDWRDELSARRDAGEFADEGVRGSMTEDEAWVILELRPGSSTQEIKAAHHRLMKKLHPDQGGSTWLASKINQAKDLLLSK